MVLKLYAVAAIFHRSAEEFLLFSAPWVAPTEAMAAASVVDLFRHTNPDKGDLQLRGVQAVEVSQAQIDMVRSQGGSEPVNLQLVRPSPEQPTPAPDGAA